MDPIIPQPETAITPEPYKHFLNKSLPLLLLFFCYWVAAPMPAYGIGRK